MRTITTQGYFRAAAFSAVLFGCNTQTPPVARVQAPAPTLAPALPPVVRPVTPSAPRSQWRQGDHSLASQIAHNFDAALRARPELSAEALFGQHALRQPSTQPLTFDVTQARYYGAVKSALQLSAAEDEVLRRQGVVVVDHLQRYSMGSAYFAIYTRDLPVLVTTDSILHAWHASYSSMLQELDEGPLHALLSAVLDGTHQQLAAFTQRPGPAQAADAALQRALQDVDLYLSVARNLLGGAGVGGSTPPAAAPPVVSSNLPAAASQNARVQELLAHIASLQLQHPDAGPTTSLYGEKRHVDFSQFQARGHYTRTPQLQAYFRTLMWLGRADLGWTLSAESPAADSDPQRGLRAAALLCLLLDQAGQGAALDMLNQTVNLFVGASDDLSVAQLRTHLTRAGVTQPQHLSDPALMSRVAQQVMAAPAQQQIRSQPLLGGTDQGETPLPRVFQVFGQRFALDSFVLSKVVFDSIQYQGKASLRQVPSGLDVMAALNNDTALELLRPELERWQYGANLMALRSGIAEFSAQVWGSDLYLGWLGALNALTAPQLSVSQLARSTPPTGKDAPRVPQVMRGSAWQRKLLQTQLASWAQLRHDTIAYSKPSYTAGTVCEYPLGFVEPYPLFFSRMRELANNAAQGLAQLAEQAKNLVQGTTATLAAGGAPPGTPQLGVKAPQRLLRQSQFMQRFAERMQQLQNLAEKELEGKPFTQAESNFLRQTIDITMVGSGGPWYTGWYTQLIYGPKPAEWLPTVADVHTVVDSFQALEVATGDVNFVVLAVDNEQHRAVYVGPAYSYYEFLQPVQQRLTDEQWALRLTQQTPPRPTWTEPLFPRPELRLTTARTLPGGE